MPRSSINYNVTTLPPNGIVTATAFNSMQDAITSIHQRGKAVMTGTALNMRGTQDCFFGPGNSVHIYRGARECGVTFQIPNGYNRFALAVGLLWPLFYTTAGGVVKHPVTSIEFRSGAAFHRFYEAENGINSLQHLVFDGAIPIPSNSGIITNAAIAMRWAMRNVDGTDLTAGTSIGPYFGYNSGFRYLQMALYRDDQC